MTTFTIERTYLVPVYEHVVVEAADLAAASAAALDEDLHPWTSDKVDYESAQETTISGAWAGSAAYVGRCLLEPPTAASTNEPPAVAATERHAIACPHCGGTDVIWDAITRWDVATQTNVVVTLLDTGSCEGCCTELKEADAVPVDEVGGVEG